MEKITTTLNISFILFTCLTVWQFYRASNASKKFLVIAGIWMSIQFFLGSTHFYENQNTIPPRFIWLLMPAFILLISLFATKLGRNFIDGLQIKQLTLLHTIRIPVEIGLYYLYIYQTIPALMTFEGQNFDILAGLTAPFIYYFGCIKNKISDRLIILWNIISLCLLLNIIVLAILSAKTPLQQFAFHQPNIAIAYFPFNWLPSIIVPLVLLAHLSSIRQLLLKIKL